VPYALEESSHSPVREHIDGLYVKVRNALCERAGIVQYEVFADRGVAVIADVNNGNFKSKLIVAQLHGE